MNLQVKEFFDNKKVQTTLEYLRIAILAVIGLRYLYLLLIFSFGRGYLLTKNQPDILDIAPYYMAGQILKNADGSKVYDYKAQEKYAIKIFLPYLQKANPKELAEIVSINEAHKKTLLNRKGVNSYFYYYPPNTLPILYLFSIFSISNLFIIINFLSLLALSLALFLGLKNYWREKKNQNFIIVFLASLIVFSPVIENIYNGQIALLCCLSFYFYYYFAKKQKNFLCGLFLSICLFKPQLGLPLLLIPFLLKQKQIVLYTALISCILCILAYFLIGFGGYKDYIISNLQTLNFTQFGSHLHPVVKPIYPIHIIVLWINQQNNYCNLSLKPTMDLIVNILFGVCILSMFCIFKFTSLKLNEKVFLGSLLALLAIQYHYSFDYGLIISSLLILFDDNGYKHFRKLLAFFILVFVLLLNIIGFIFSLQKIAFFSFSYEFLDIFSGSVEFFVLFISTIFLLVFYMLTRPVIENNEIKAY